MVASCRSTFGRAPGEGSHGAFIFVIDEKLTQNRLADRLPHPDGLKEISLTASPLN